MQAGAMEESCLLACSTQDHQPNDGQPVLPHQSLKESHTGLPTVILMEACSQLVLLPL